MTRAVMESAAFTDTCCAMTDPTSDSKGLSDFRAPAPIEHTGEDSTMSAKAGSVSTMKDAALCILPREYATRA